jgi:hypothetical protein
MSYIIYYIVECNLPKWMFLCKMYFTAMCPNPEDSGFQLIDWSDASVTQSALEEALLSNMQHH